MEPASSILDDPSGASAAVGRAAAAAAAPDLCGVGVALRALCLVHGVLALGLAFTAPGAREWSQGLAAAAAVSTPATLGWLLLGCALMRRLRSRLPQAGARRPNARAVAGLAALLGAACAALAWVALLGLRGEPPAPAAGLASVLLGATLAAAYVHALQLREQGRLPADTVAHVMELQERIRPHFLFNTLNTAIALVRLDPQRAEAVLEDLAELFRAALEAGAAAATLGSEIEIAQRYLDIERVRFGERLRVHWELDPAAASAPVPTLLLQPLVENAVRHGVEPAQDGGEIRIRTRLRGDQVELRVTNTVPVDPAVAAVPGHGIGLASVRQRLSLMHDLRASVSAGLDGPGRYRVEVRLPPGVRVA